MNWENTVMSEQQREAIAEKPLTDDESAQRGETMKYQVVRVIPASAVFQHGEYREVLAEHSHYILAWLSCYLWHNSVFLPCHIERVETP